MKAKDNLIFLREYIRNFQTTGSLCPTSRWAAKEMIKPMEGKRGIKILELGPGTGSLTRPIISRLGEEDTLTICEVNPAFMSQLKKNLEKEPAFHKRKNNITFHCCPMQELPEDNRYDIIICAIPFLNLPSAVVAEIFAKLRILSHEKTEMTYYEYIGLRRVGLTVSPRKRRERFKKLDGFLQSIFPTHLVDRKDVWWNLFPIHVYRLKELGNIRVESTILGKELIKSNNFMKDGFEIAM